MAEPDRNSPSTSSSSTNREYSDAAAASSSSNSSSAREEDRNNYPYNHIHVHHDHHFQRSELEQHTGGFSYRGNFVSFDDASNVIRDDTWSCIIVVLTFWFFG